MIKPTPITLITGYLGSGKTTLINHILAHNGGRKLAVIVNDIGEVNIDAELIDSKGIVSSQDDSLVALQNGCICCTLKADLINQLADLVNSHRFDHILIEASGICEPVPIAQSICYMEEEFKRKKLPKFYYLDAIVSVADALRLKDEFGYGANLSKEGGEEDIESLVFQQLEFCDIILLNKASELSEEENEKVSAAIRGIQRKARIIPTDYAIIDVGEILDTRLFNFESASTSAAWIEEFESWDNEHEDDDDDDDHDHDHEHEHEEHEHEHEEGHHHHHHHHHEHGLDQNDDEGTAEEYGIQTYVYYRRKPFDRNAFLDWAKTNHHHIIRSKGILYFTDEEKMSYVYETAGRQIRLGAHGPWFSTEHTDKEIEELRKNNPYYAHDYDEVYKEKLVKLVFIGQNLKKKEIKAELDAI